MMVNKRQLRSTIRPTTGYDDLVTAGPTSAILTSMHLAREQSASGAVVNTAHQRLAPSRRKVRITQSAEVAEFDPALPPVALTLSTERSRNQTICPSEANRDQTSLAVDWSMSNCESNPTYASNTVLMASNTKETDMTDNLSIYDSEDGSIDDQEAFERKIINPTWKDIKPAIQLQIACALLKNYNLANACTKLGIDKEDRSKLEHYLDTYYRQITREDKALATMRKKQLDHLMSIDQSTVKRYGVPHQLVLNKAHEKSNSIQGVFLKIARPEIEFCRVDDLLTARQFLRRQNLNENLAGEWVSPLVELASFHDVGENDLPERFQWKDNWTLPEQSFISTQRPVRDCAPGPSFDTLPSFVKSMCSKAGPYTTINPRDLLNRDVKHPPFEHWSEHTPFYLLDEFQEAQRKIREIAQMEMLTAEDISETTRVQIGSKQEARLSLAYRDQGYQRLLANARETEALKAEIQKSREHVPLPAFVDQTQSKSSKERQESDGPLRRCLGGCWSFIEAHPADSQYRYESQIEQARLEREEAKRRYASQQMPFEAAVARGSPHPSPGSSASGGTLHDIIEQGGFSGMFMLNLPNLQETFGYNADLETASSRTISPADDQRTSPDDTFMNYVVTDDVAK